MESVEQRLPNRHASEKDQRLGRIVIHANILLTAVVVTGIVVPFVEATAAMVWTPGVEGAVKVNENNDTPMLAKLVKRCLGACAGAFGPARVTCC